MPTLISVRLDCRLYLRRASAEACRSRIKLDAARRLGFVIGGGQRAMLLKEPVDVLLDRIEERVTSRAPVPRIPLCNSFDLEN